MVAEGKEGSAKTQEPRIYTNACLGKREGVYSLASLLAFLQLLFESLSPRCSFCFFASLCLAYCVRYSQRVLPSLSLDLGQLRLFALCCCIKS